VPLPAQILSRRFRLPRAQTEDILSERDLRIPMSDGTTLLADRHVARATAGTPQPTVLVRSPYGRRQLVGLIFGRLLAERGLQVLIQSVRGTFGSEGEFSPFDERSDGLATLQWIRGQAWHSEKIGMIGPSYLGIVQWAVAPEAGDDLAALSIQVSASQFHGQTYAGGTLALETAASWLVMVAVQERRLAPVAMARGLRKLGPILEQTPVGELDALATGAEVPWFRQALASPAREDAYWVQRDFAAGVGNVAAPVQLIGGWYDIFLPWMLEDFAALQDAGRSPQLVIGPWTHAAPGLMARGMREGLAWLRAHLLGDGRLLSPAHVRIKITGERTGGGWRELPTWPPPGMTERRLYLAAHGELGEAPPSQPPSDGAHGDPTHNGGATSAERYRYDPADPTPSFGGPVLLAHEAVLDNRPLEARADVLTYTTETLPRTVEAIGPVRVEIFVRTSSPHFDLFARVCDVDPNGASLNVCDALARALPGRFEADAEGIARVAFDLWPIGHRFAAGNRIRLQVSSGAHPRYARNPGTGEDLATATEMQPVDVEVLRDAAHASVLVLPAA
jgi:putative CocE/NonD family hydrolase